MLKAHWLNYLGQNLNSDTKFMFIWKKTAESVHKIQVVKEILQYTLLA